MSKRQKQTAELETDREKDTCELNKEFFDIRSFSSAAF